MVGSNTTGWIHRFSRWHVAIAAPTITALVLITGLGCSKSDSNIEPTEAAVVFDLIEGFAAASISRVQPAPAGSGSLPKAYVNPERGVMFVPLGVDVVYELELPPECVLLARDAKTYGAAASHLELVWTPENGAERVVTRDLCATPERCAGFGNAEKESGRLIMRARAGAEEVDPRAGIRVFDPKVVRGKPCESRDVVDQHRDGDQRLNIVVYLIDALRADRVGRYGYSKGTTPRIDDFASSAVVFTGAQAQTSWTRPAVASIFTGLLPQQHTAVDKSDVLPNSSTTIAEILGADGYETAAVISNGNVSQVYGFSQGFSYYKFLEEVQIGSHVVRSTDVNEAVFAWLDEFRGPDPFFLYVHTVDPHLPYAPPAPYREAFGPGIDDPSVGTVEMVNHLAANAELVTPELIGQLSDLYDGEVAANDAAFGEFVAGFRERDLWDNTVIVLVSDHGEEFYDHQGWTHGNTLFAEMLDVPLMMKIPGVAPQTVVEIVQHVDLFPTLLDLAGVDTPDGVFGVSAELLWTSDDRSEWVNRGLAHLDIKDRFGLSWVDPQWKLLIRRLRDGSPHVSLFDRGNDPREQHDLSSEFPEVVNGLRERHDGEIATAGDPLPAMKATADREAEVEAQLKALGYL